MNLIKKLITLAAVPALALALIAGTTSDAEAARHERRQKRQAARIHNGVESGALTKAETRQLAAQQAHVRVLRRAARADGRITAAERARINRAQRLASRNIVKKKHNRRHR